jgi:hypothetical protein
MRVEVEPRQADIVAYRPLIVTVTITNTSTIIGGYTLRLLGADPTWVEFPEEQISLFPEEVRIVTILITPPKGLAAGSRRVAVQVRELTAPFDSSITDIDLNVPEAKAIAVRTDPVAVTAGKKASFSVIAENTGNTMIRGRLDGDDPEGRVSFTFEPPMITLAPGEHCVVDMRAKARRPFTGSPVVRPLGLYLDEADKDSFFSSPDGEIPKGPRGEDSMLAGATFVQKSKLSRGALSLVGLLIAVTVFAIVITVALGRLVGQSTADRDLALQVAAARDSGAAGGGSSSLSGTVHLLTSGAGLGAVSVNLYDAGNTQTPLATTASDQSGAYSFNQLAAGKYKLSYQRAGFVQTWYPAATSDADATAVELKPVTQQHGLDVTMGGVPALISGTVVGEDVSASTLYLETVPGTVSSPAHTNSKTSAKLPTTTDAVSTDPLPPAGAEAVVQKIAVGADGTFALNNVPSPSTYELVVVKTGYATTTQQLDVGAGEQRTGVSLTLRKGDGLISGTVTAGARQLGGVTITATSGQSTTTTVSLKTGAVKGAFVLRSLPTPGDFTITAAAPGYASQTLTVSLAAGQLLKGVAITLSNSSGSIKGEVFDTGIAAESGVTVTATDGKLLVQTETQSGTKTAGQWAISGLPVPGSYTLTFSRADLASQTLAVSLDANGAVQSAQLDQKKLIEVHMASSTAILYGVVTAAGGADTGICSGTGDRLGEATVTLASGTTTYTVTSASRSDSSSHTQCGSYRIEQVPPGVYTLTVSASGGISPNSQVISLAAGQTRQLDVPLANPASINGTLVDSAHKPLDGWTVFLYPAATYPNTYTQTAKTDSAGFFHFDVVDAGRYVIAFGPTADPATAAQTDSPTVLPGTATPLGTIVVTSS